MKTVDEIYQDLLAAYEPCPRAGLVDGITGAAALSEDGFPVDRVKVLRTEMEALP